MIAYQNAPPEPKRKLSYPWAQGLFFGAYTAYIFGIYSSYSGWQSLSVIIHVSLCSLMLLVTHSLRAYYKRIGHSKPLSYNVISLLISLPVVAVGIQAVIYAELATLGVVAPSVVEGMIPYSFPFFFGYVLNTLIVLILWSVSYLMVSQYRKQSQMEIAYWRSQVALRETELQFLHSQINSHFLFNAMNNVRALILEDPERARLSIVQLSNLLRAVMQTKSRETISLEDEMGLVADYLALESLQYEERLTIDWKLDPACNAIAIPPMVVQTLVENAIRHGIAKLSAGGRVSIESIIRGGFLLITVCNPVASTNSLDTKNTVGLGIANARERLARLFGEAASIEHASSAEGVTAVVKIPL